MFGVRDGNEYAACDPSPSATDLKVKIATVWAKANSFVAQDASSPAPTTSTPAKPAVAPQLAATAPPTTQANLSKEESYLKLREELLKSEWTAWTKPPINKWKAPFSEVMICDEGICSAYFSKLSDQNNVRHISYGVCGSYEQYYDTAENKKMCSGRKDFLVVLTDKLISTEKAQKDYAVTKAHFE